jgi:hypothetical protein
VEYYVGILFTKFYPASFCQSLSHMQRKLLYVISVDFNATGQLLIIYSAFIKYLRKMGIKQISASAMYRLQEGL